jgi:flavodoxin I
MPSTQIEISLSLQIHNKELAMSKIGVFFGSTLGDTGDAAEAIRAQFGDADIFDIGRTAVAKMSDYDVLILGSSTWGLGELQDDWEAVLDDLRGLDLSGKKVALFGSGDQSMYDETYCDALGILYGALQDSKATFVGSWPTAGYEHAASRAVVDGEFIGLALDANNQGDLTDERIAAWVAQLKTDLTS